MLTIINTKMQSAYSEKILPAVLWLAIFLAGVMPGSFLHYNASLISSLEISLIILTLLLQAPDARIVSLYKRYKLVTIASVLLVIALISACFDFRLSHGLALGLTGAYAALFLSPHLLKLIRNNQVLLTLVTLWVISTTISYYFSPVTEKSIMWTRYEQTLIHLFTFLALLWHFQQHPRQLSPAVFSALPLSALIIALSTLSIYLSQPDAIRPYQWFSQPPFNSHIRHAGYFFTATLAVTLCVLALRIMPRIYFLCLNVVLVILWAYLLWAGGRTATASVMLVAAFICFVLYKSDKGASRFLLVSTVTFLIGLAIAEWLSVFPWNGLIDGVSRTVNADSLNRLSNSRIGIWTYSLEAVKNNLWFGLGANGYLSIPDRYPLTGQPHSMLVQFLVEWGVIGAGVFMIILILTAKRGYSRLKTIKTGPQSLSLLMACSLILALSLHGLTDGTYFYPQPVFLLSIMFAIIWSIPQAPRGKPPPVPGSSNVEASH